MPWLIGYVATIVLANIAVETVGIVPVGFGLQAPAAVYFVGLAFVFRDGVQERYGKWVTVGAIGLGAALSAVFSPQLALASGLAFLVSELADMGVYTPLRERNLTAAVIASNAVGLTIDSMIFLGLAFGSLEFLYGQILGKAWMTLVALGLIPALRRTRTASQ